MQAKELNHNRIQTILIQSAPKNCHLEKFITLKMPTNPKNYHLDRFKGWTFGLRVQRANHDPGIHVCLADVETQGCSSVAASVGLKPKVRFRDPRHRRFPCVAFCKNCHAQGKEAQKEQESSSSTRRPRQNMFERGLKVCQTFVARSKKADSTLRSSQAVPHPSINFGGRKRSDVVWPSAKINPQEKCSLCKAARAGLGRAGLGWALWPPPILGHPLLSAASS